MSISITLIIIIVTSLISWQALEHPDKLALLKHYPYQEARTGQWYRFLTSGFVHGSVMHLILNMYVFYIFGEYVEQYFVVRLGPTIGRILYVVFYLTAIIVADIPTFVKQKENPGFASVGASGAVSGILFVFIMINPWAILELFFILPIPAIIAGIAYLIYSSWASKNRKDHIDHLAHFYGALYGIAFALIALPKIGTDFVLRLMEGLPF
jgi:membrane associated rhomboid family serine protease